MDNFESISRVFHEEADTRYLMCGMPLSTPPSDYPVDSDAVVVAMYAFSFRLQKLGNLWVEYENVPFHSQKRPQGVPDLLPFFNAFTGARTVFSFAGIGKVT